MTTEAKVDRNVFLPCPRCGGPEVGIAVRLDMLASDDDDTFQCMDCNAEFGVKDI